MTSDRRHTLRVAGQVQGVGFRPFAYRLARDLGLAGSVRNDPGGVTIEVVGRPETLERFVVRLAGEAPPLAVIEDIRCVADDPSSECPAGFRIVESDRALTTMAPFAMCPRCRAEYEDPADRRFHAQPTCCPDCGPQVRLVDAAARPLVQGDPRRGRRVGRR